jgi:hypothetical protein
LILSVEVVTAPDATSLMFVPLIALAIWTDPPVTSTFPALEVRVALDAVVIAPVPESEMFPASWIAEVGATEVPPLIVTAPAEFKVPEPAYVPLDEG